MAVRKQCKAKGCKASPRCEHPWWLDVMYQGERYRMPVDAFALVRGAKQLVTSKQARPHSPVQNANRSRDSQTMAACYGTALSFIQQHGIGAERQTQRDHFLLAGVEVPEFGVNLRGSAHFQPNGMRGEELLDLVRGRGRLELPMYGLGDKNALEQVGQEILQLDQDQVIERRSVGNDNHRGPRRSRSRRSCSRSSSS